MRRHTGDEGFILHRSRGAVTYTIQKLVRGGVEEWAAKPLRPQSRPAIVVGAGPSARAVLASAWFRWMVDHVDARVIVVNASAKLVQPRDISAIVVRESIPTADQIPECELAVLDLQTHPDTEQAALKRCNRVAYFAGAEMRHLALCAALEVPPLISGTAALTAAAELALVWGAEDVYLVGVDLAYASAGGKIQAYADGTPRDDMTMERVGDELIMKGNERDDARHRAAGIPPHGRKYRALEVQGTRGDRVLTSAVWTDQITALGHMTLRWPDRGLWRVGDGARLDGWKQFDPEDRSAPPRVFFRRDDDTGPIELHTVDFDLARARVIQEAAGLEAISTAMLADRVDVARLAGLVELDHGAPIIQPLADAELLALDRSGITDPEERARIIYSAYARAAAAARDAAQT